MKTLKKLSIIVAVGLSTIFFSGCSDYLDVSDDLAGELSMEEVFNNTGIPFISSKRRSSAYKNGSSSLLMA